MPVILIEKDPQNLIPKDVTSEQRLMWAWDYRIWDLKADGTRGASLGPLSRTPQAESATIYYINQVATEVGPGEPVPYASGRMALARMVGTIPSGTVSATAQVQGTTDPAMLTGWVDLLSVPLTLSSAASGAQDLAAHAGLPYVAVRFNVLTLTTGATLRNTLEQA